MKAIQALARDHSSGSTILARRAGGILARVPPQLGGTSLENLVRAVAAAQPSMAAVWNICHRWRHEVRAGASPRDAARHVVSQLAEAQQAAARSAAQLVRSAATVATYSSSSSVLAAFLQAREEGARFRVLCSESRPMLEGRRLARALAAAGIPVEFHTDASLMASLAACDLVLLGCDAILRDRFVNKAGSHALLRMAAHHHVPAHVIADSFKFLPRFGTAPFVIRKEAPGEVWAGAPRRVAVRNVYFEAVPLPLCAGIATEHGILSPAQVRARLRRLARTAALRYAPERGRMDAMRRG